MKNTKRIHSIFAVILKAVAVLMLMMCVYGYMSGADYSVLCNCGDLLNCDLNAAYVDNTVGAYHCRISVFNNLMLIHNIPDYALFIAIGVIALLIVLCTFFVCRARFKKSTSQKNIIITHALDNIPTATICVASNGKVLYMNKAAEAMNTVDRAGMADSRIINAVESETGSAVMLNFNDKSYKATLNRTKDCTVIYLSPDNKQASPHINQFISNITHELRTPLTVIKGFAQNLEDLNLSEEKKQQHYRSIITETDRLSELISDMQLLSKLNSGALKINTEILDIAYCADDFRDYLATLCADKSINTKADIPEQALAKFEFNRFRQLLIILCDNAKKVTPAGGNITLHIKEGVLMPSIVGNRNFYISNPDITDMENRYFIYVEDNGCPIEKSALPHIFERFYTTDRIHGSGLGLSLLYEILRSVGECAVAASADGETTLIGFTLIKPTASEIREANKLYNDDNCYTDNAIASNAPSASKNVEDLRHE